MQCSVINHDGKEYEKHIYIYVYMYIYICMHVSLNHFAVRQK